MEEHELIDQYLRGELTPEAKRHFETRLATDPALREETELHKAALEIIRQGAREELKAALKSRWKPGTFNHKQPFRRLFWIMGSLLILAGLLFWQYQQQQKTEPVPANPTITPDTSQRAQSNQTPIPDTLQKNDLPSQLPQSEAQKIYAANFLPYSSNELHIMVRAASENEPFTQFVQAYLSQDYKKALEKFEILSEEDKNNENILFLKANALLADNQTSTAIAILDKICSEKTSNYLPDAQWYAGLAYLKKGDPKRAKNYFKEIVSTPGGNHPYAEKARQLLKTDLLK